MKMRLEIQVPEPSILMQTSSDPISLSSFSWWKHSVAKSMEQRCGGAGLEERKEREDQCRGPNTGVPNEVELITVKH